MSYLLQQKVGREAATDPIRTFWFEPQSKKMFQHKNTANAAAASAKLTSLSKEFKLP